MPKEILTRCGYRCDLCLAYKENILKDDKRQLLSDGWNKYFGFRIEPKDLLLFFTAKITDGQYNLNKINPRYYLHFFLKEKHLQH